jgi:pyruvate dehydrogenase E1 component alpha subunit
MDLSREKKLNLYREMVRIRTFENGVRQLIKEGIIGHVSFSTGGEAVAVGVCSNLMKEDQIGSTHRPLGHLIAKGSDLKKIMAEITAKKTGYNKGKGGPYHIFAPEVGALGANGIVGGSVPMCAGYALGNQLKNNGMVSVSFFGEGASNQGGVQETLNLAACWNLPIVFVCENSSPEVQTMLGHEIDYPQLCIENVSERASSYGMPGETHEGWDVIKVYTAAMKAIKRAREGRGPTLLEYKIHRISPEEETNYCPVLHFQENLFEEEILSVDLDEKIHEEQAKEVKDAIDFALGSPEPELLDAWKDIFVEET